ncbi:MAG: glycosyltransferase family 4 protein [Ruminococcaceae bacterium]|nr:glycosyltransferase family 4 protein [Oscillospiraceae bacterium]
MSFLKKILITATVQSHICQFHKPLVEMLREQGEVEIHVAARNNLEEKNGLKLDFADRVFDVPFQRSPFSAKNLKAYRKLKKIIDENHYDYIHSNTPVGGMLTRIAARKCRSQGTRVLYTAHGFHFYKGAPRKNWIIYYPIERFAARWTDALITINAEDYALAREKFNCPVFGIHGVGVSAERYCPVTPEQQGLLREKLGFSPGERLILCVGELLPNKNQQMAVSAMEQVIQQFPNARLLLAGNGPQKETLEALVRSRGLEKHVVFLGYCTNLEEYQQIAEIALSCSRREGLPLNIIEAMLSRNPVVATHNRGHDELVRDGETGYLLQADDVDAMAQRLCALFAQPDLADQMGRQGLALAMCYTVPVVQEELRKIYFGADR